MASIEPDLPFEETPERPLPPPTDDQPIATWAETHDDFVLALLGELRRHNYHPAAWTRFLARSWARSRATASAHPRLVASWAGTVGALALGQATALDLEARLGTWHERHTGTQRKGTKWKGTDGARTTALRALPWSFALLGEIAFDAYAHLGMNARQRGDRLDPTLGMPNALTLTRRSISALLWGHWLARRAAPRGLLLGALVAAGATDVGDGALARATGRQTRLGAYLDAEADYEFWSGLALNLGAARRLPRWFVVLLLARFTLPFAVALASYFGWVNRVTIGSTRLGKVAGVAQAVTCSAVLLPARPPDQLPDQLPEQSRRGWRLLFGATAALLVIAPLMQLGHLRVQERRS